VGGERGKSQEGQFQESQILVLKEVEGEVIVLSQEAL